jgi:hypothetical protein
MVTRTVPLNHGAGPCFFRVHVRLVGGWRADRLGGRVCTQMLIFGSVVFDFCPAAGHRASVSSSLASTRREERGVARVLLLWVLDGLSVAEELVVLVVAAVAASEFGVVGDELDSFDPFDLFEAELDLVAEPQRSAMSE